MQAVIAIVSFQNLNCLAAKLALSLVQNTIKVEAFRLVKSLHHVTVQ